MVQLQRIVTYSFELTSSSSIIGILSAATLPGAESRLKKMWLCCLHSYEKFQRLCQSAINDRSQKDENHE